MISVVIAKRRMLTSTICEFELRNPDGEALPGYSSGAHIQVVTPSGETRSYSLVNDGSDLKKYVIAVKRENQGRGGSLSMHTSTVEGDELKISSPSNTFRLRDAPRYLFIAGGIGITPIMSMVMSVARNRQRPFSLIYTARSADEAAYTKELRSLGDGGNVMLHDSVRSSARFDFWPFLKEPTDTHVYYCGPESLMDAIHAQTVHWPRSAVFYEAFRGISATAIDSEPFQVRRASTGEVYAIPADRSVIEVLRSAGVNTKSSCHSGTCGTCRVRLLAGSPDHRDLVLTESERSEYFMPCVSRSRGDELTLDI